jgi:hypothetical protein
MPPYNVDVVDLYDLVAVLGYFNADISKRQDIAEVVRVQDEVGTYCQLRNIPVAIFTVGLMDQVMHLNTPKSKEIIERINTKNEKEEVNSFFKDSTEAPDDTKISLWLIENSSKFVSYFVDNYALYDLIAELGYFSVDGSKKNCEDRGRVWADVQKYCKETRIPFDKFVFWLMHRVSLRNTPHSQTIIKRIKEYRVRNQYDGMNDYGSYEYDYDWWEEELERRAEPFMFFYGDPGLDDDCEWNDDWDGPKY